jgi:light-regulated signal transduction histidine kinase (bacteriophytochrome)
MPATILIIDDDEKLNQLLTQFLGDFGFNTLSATHPQDGLKIGIPHDELPFIFEPFYRVDKSRAKNAGGFGLGLSLCKTIMEAHEGRIEVESTPGVGTTVSLYFPIGSDSP